MSTTIEARPQAEGIFLTVPDVNESFIAEVILPTFPGEIDDLFIKAWDKRFSHPKETDLNILDSEWIPPVEEPAIKRFRYERDNPDIKAAALADLDGGNYEIISFTLDSGVSRLTYKNRRLVLGIGYLPEDPIDQRAQHTNVIREWYNVDVRDQVLKF